MPNLSSCRAMNRKHLNTDLKLKTCSLFHDILLIQKFDDTFIQVHKFSSSLWHEKRKNKNRRENIKSPIVYRFPASVVDAPQRQNTWNLFRFQVSFWFQVCNTYGDLLVWKNVSRACNCNFKLNPDLRRGGEIDIYVHTWCFWSWIFNVHKYQSQSNQSQSIVS